MNIIESFKNKFTQQFPNSMIHVSEAALSDDMVITFTLAQPEDYPNKIINNDPMYHIIFVIDCKDGKFHVESTLSGLYVNPREEYLAMSCVKTKMRKKTGTPEQVEKHLNKWLDNLKQIVVENKNDIYGGLDKYQKYIVE